MKHAIIVAHPNPKSLTLSIAHAYAQAVGALGQTSVTRDLYKLGFDPCLRAGEIPGPDGYRCGADAQRERDLIADADVFALLYPFWFNAPPAILKGYVDRVFSMGFGYEPAPSGGNQSMLDGKRLISITTSGAPDAWVKDTAALETLRRGFDAHVGAVCGLIVTDHLHFGGVVPGITAEAGREILATVKDTVRTTFDPALYALV
jgi:NAD(P)H dehydrogenase (quinone)